MPNSLGENATGDAAAFAEVRKSVETAEAQRRERMDLNASTAAGKSAEVRTFALVCVCGKICALLCVTAWRVMCLGVACYVFACMYG